MYSRIFTLTTILIFITSLIMAQTKSFLEEQDSTSKVNSSNSIDGTTAANDEINFKNEIGNAIITITDEGSNKGSITLPEMSTAPNITSDKLYNEAGTLKFNGTALGGSGTTLSIGDSYQGGIICWLDPSGEHGLIASSQDLNNGNVVPLMVVVPGTFLSSFGNGIYMGEVNTKYLMTLQSQAPIDAAMLCSDHSVTENGVIYDDWYLPSLDEMQIIMTNLYLQNPGNFPQGNGYWTSTQDISNINNSLNSQKFYFVVPTFPYWRMLLTDLLVINNTIIMKGVRAIRRF